MNHKRIRHFLVMTLFTILIVSPVAVSAWQNSKNADGSHFIERFDKSGDGLVSAEEFASGVDDKFTRLDRNADGYIDAAEAPRRSFHHGRKCKKMMADFDADGDGRLSSEEFPGPANHFTGLDADSDGFLDAEELRAARSQRKGFCSRQDDTDRDGKVSRTEFSGPAALFDDLDKDADGFLTREEARPGCRNTPRACPFESE